MPLSRSMTDSEIDYEYYKRYWDYKYPDTWKYWRDVYTYPSDYISSYNRYLYLDTDVDEELLNRELRYTTKLAESRRWYNEEWRRRLQRRLDEKYYLYSPGDSSLLVLQDELRNLDAKAYRLKNLEADLASIRPRVRSRLAFNRLRRTLYDMNWW